MHDVSCGGQLRHARTLKVRRHLQHPAPAHVTDFMPAPTVWRVPRRPLCSCSGGASRKQRRTAMRVGRMVVSCSDPVTPGSGFGLGLDVNVSCVLVPSVAAPFIRCAVLFRRTAASSVRRVHPLADIVRDSVDGCVRDGVVPCGGTRSEVVAHRAGATRAIEARRPLSTGLPVQGRRVDQESSVSAAQGGVRFGVYTGPMQTQKITAHAGSALAGAVGR